jgi:hypothetical protein
VANEVATTAFLPADHSSLLSVEILCDHPGAASRYMPFQNN